MTRLRPLGAARRGLPRRATGLALAAAMTVTWLPSIVGLDSPVIGAVTPPTLYVDGKHRSDNSTGSSWAMALKTINTAARRVPRGTGGAGWTIVVRGYTDYLYRERPIPGGWDRNGVSGSPIVFQAEGWSPGSTSYVRPIVEGGVSAPGAGKNWVRSSYAGVWYAPWATKPRNFLGSASAYDTALFQDITTWLWQRPSLGDLARTPKAGGFWYDGAAHRLYVAAQGGGDPNAVDIEVPTQNGFYFDGYYGGSHVEVRGFEIRHAAMGVAFVAGADHSAAVDDVARANDHIGFHTSGRATSTGFDPASFNVFLRDAGSYNTVQAFKIDAGSQDTTVCDSSAARNALQGIKVQGPDASTDPRVTRDITICRNQVHHQTFARPDHPYENTTGLTVANGARVVTIDNNDVWANNIGIHVTQQGGFGSPVVGLRVSHNRVWNNIRFGLDTRDGSPSPSDGIGSLASTFNLYWGNGIGILVDHGSMNKGFNHDTVFANDSVGFKVGCGCNLASAEVTIKNSLITTNGGWGIQVLGGGRANLSYSGLSANASGATSGRVTRAVVNTRPAGYLTTAPSSPDFLRIATSSYQYTAGVGGSPVGAKY